MNLAHYERELRRYCDGVVDDVIPSCRYVKLAVRRHLDDLDHQQERGLVWDKYAAARACGFFPVALRHSKGSFAGQPFTLSPSQIFVASMVWGWRKKQTGTRRFSRALVMVARKWGKSEFAAGVALRHALCDEPTDPGAEVYLAATKEDQVRKTTFKQCCRMVSSSPVLRDRIQVGMKALVVHQGDMLQPDSAIYPIGSDSNTSDGFDLSAAILDELHAWQKHHHGFYERMTTAGGSRKQEIVWFFTTEGDDKSVLLHGIKEQAVRALESVDSRQFDKDYVFAFIASLDEGDDPFAVPIGSPEFEKLVIKANPNYPTTPLPHYVRQLTSEAADNPIERNKVLRFLFNRRVSSVVQPIEPARWQSLAADVTIPSSGVVGGFDVGRNDDFAAWALAWLDDEDKLCLYSHSYTCEQRAKPLASATQLFIESGELSVHPGNQVDFSIFEADIAEASLNHNVFRWSFDPHFAAQMAQQLQRQLGDEALVKFVQTPANYNEACRSLVARFRAGTLRPDKSLCMAWQFRNLSFCRNSKDEWMPEKGLSPEYKIDAAVACLMAYRLLMTLPKPRRSLLEEEIFA
jgi:phage terminase large subunit-like protein